MKEFIERGALLELETFLQDADGFDCSAVLSVDIRAAKAADVVEVKHGEWVCVNEDENVWMCSGADGCGGEFILNDKTPLDNDMIFCPYCGAKMDGECREG